MEHKTIETEKILIRPFLKSDITQRYVSWLNNKKLLIFSENRHNSYTLDSALEYFNLFNFSKDYWYAIILKSSGAHVGNINAIMDSPNSVADLGILLGDDSSPKGTGTEAWFLFIYFLLKTQSVRRVCAGTMCKNKAMLKVFKKTGMIEDGIWKDYFQVEDKFSDYVHYAISLNILEDYLNTQNPIGLAPSSIQIKGYSNPYSISKS